MLSLSELVSFLGKKAEEAGVDVFPGFAAAGLVLEERKKTQRRSGGGVGGGGERGLLSTTTTTTRAVAGVFTGDVGVAKDGVSHRKGFTRGVEVRARATLLAEGARGSLTQQAEREFSLRDGAGAGDGSGRGAEPQTYALGLKEVWTVQPEKHRPGTAWHTVGFPLSSETYGGGFLYHLGEEKEEEEEKKKKEEAGGGGKTSEDDDEKSTSPSSSSSKPRRVSLGLVVGLDYKDPTLNPYQEFQKFKAHPRIREVLERGACTSYGARVLNEGGWQSLPRLDFPGGALLGCAAGTLVVPRIKGVHTAVASGIMAADVTFDALREDDERARAAEERREEEKIKREAAAKEDEEEEFSEEEDDEEDDDLLKPYARPALDLSGYDRLLRESWVGRELEEARNIRPR